MHCLFKMEIAAQDGHLRRGAELEQEAGNLILFLINPGPLYFPRKNGHGV